MRMMKVRKENGCASDNVTKPMKNLEKMAEIAEKYHVQTPKD